MSRKKKKSENIERYIASSGSAEDLSSFLSPNVVAGARLAAENEGAVHVVTTARSYELRLIKLEEFARKEGDDAILFGPNKRPFYAATIKTFMQFLLEPKRKQIGSLKGQGIKVPSLKGHEAAFRFWFQKFGHVGTYREKVVRDPSGEITEVIPEGNPMDDQGVKQTIKQLVKRAKRLTQRDIAYGMRPYEPKKAPPFAVKGLRGLWLWTVSIFSFGLFLRGEEPLRLKVKHVKLPPHFDTNCGKIPSRIYIKIPWSKADRQAKGICSGYLFPRVATNNHSCLASRRGVSSYRKAFAKMTEELFNKGYTTHSIRRSAARWAARCGADDSTIKRAGRWKSNSFELYTQSARADMIKEHHDGSVINDHLIWMFKPLR